MHGYSTLHKNLKNVPKSTPLIFCVNVGQYTYFGMVKSTFAHICAKLSYTGFRWVMHTRHFALFPKNVALQFQEHLFSFLNEYAELCKVRRSKSDPFTMTFDLFKVIQGQGQFSNVY